MPESILQAERKHAQAERKHAQAERKHAHWLLDVLPEEKVHAARSYLESMLDPVARALANAPCDDEPVCEEEARDIDAARASLARGGVSNEQVLAEFGLTLADFERMGREPVESEANHLS